MKLLKVNNYFYIGYLFCYLSSYLLNLKKNFLGSKLEINLKFLTERDPDRLYIYSLLTIYYCEFNL